MQVKFKTAEFQLSEWEKLRITAFCEITGEYRDETITVWQVKNEDDLKSVVATTEAGSVISYFDVTDPDNTVDYLL